VPVALMYDMLLSTLAIFWLVRAAREAGGPARRAAGPPTIARGLIGRIASLSAACRRRRSARWRCSL